MSLDAVSEASSKSQLQTAQIENVVQTTGDAVIYADLLPGNTTVEVALEVGWATERELEVYTALKSDFLFNFVSFIFRCYFKARSPHGGERGHHIQRRL